MDSFADVMGKMRMQTHYYELKKHANFVEIFIVGITLRAIYVRHKTSHRLKWITGEWGDTSPRICTGEATMMLISQNSAHIMYLTTRYAVYFYSFAQGIMYYIAFSTGSVWSSHLEWFPAYQKPQKSLCLTQRIPRPTEQSTELTSQSHTLASSIKYRYMNRQKFSMLKD